MLGDSGQLLQVLTNLCINAGDAMPQGGRLEITVRERELGEGDVGHDDLLSPGPYVSICVRDDGLGMDAETRRRIFDPFFTTKPRGKGTGLGLATAHAIVRDHGGRIVVESSPGRGTLFEVQLPGAQPRRGARARMTEDVAQQPMRGVVLLADDEELVRFATKRVLEHVGIEVLTAADGEEALEIHAAQAHRIDLVVLDLDMPRLDGEQAYARLREHNPNLHVVICSGYLDEERVRALRAAGVDGFIHKPYDSLTLVQAIGKALAAVKPAES